jgi:soluble lytic murein transglycosylase-like protein
MQSRTAHRRILIALAAPALVAAASAVASAQSTHPPPPPRQSTRLTTGGDAATGGASGSGGSSLVREFDTAPGAAKPAEAPEAATAVKAAVPDAPRPSSCTTGDPAVDAVIREAAERYGVDGCLVVAVMAQESGYRRFAVSPKGASGYMQLMPDTARRFGVVDLFDARQNIHAGTRYLRFLLDRFGGSLELALAGYNAGEGAVERYGMKIPPFAETQNYVRLISGRYLSRAAAKTDFRPLTGVAPPLPPPVAAAPPGGSRPSVAWRISVSFDPNDPK